MKSIKSEVSPQPAAVFAALEELEHSHRKRYEGFCRSVRNEPGLKRAESFLRFVASDAVDCRNQEATVYLASRGYDCTHETAEITAEWTAAAQNAVNQPMAAGQASVSQPDGHANTVEQWPGLERQSRYVVSDFWRADGLEMCSIDATMLRTAQWCGLREFAPWWRRLAARQERAILHEGLLPQTLVEWLFNMCRSDLGLELMDRTLNLALAAVQLSGDLDEPCPWVERRGGRLHGSWSEASITYAGALAFCIQRLSKTSNANHGLLGAAVECLNTHRCTDGSWPRWASDAEGSTEATAIALHALALAAPHERCAMRAAQQWLWKQQQDDGSWREDGCDPVYLTVLVLDAIAAAAGQARLTFNPGERGQNSR